MVHSALLVDLSLNGALVAVEPARDIPPGTHVKLDILLDNSADAIICIEAKVVFAKDRMLGLRRTAIDMDSMVHLRRVLELNFGSAALIDREIAELGDTNWSAP
jgi:hypothetical protein